ncbi:MAG TPA: hypothetical protein VEF03_00335, partial [Candidatus Binataceae bacterium]|nr:hypothetical protein [Candidatus Binataceae bacterium]
VVDASDFRCRYVSYCNSLLFPAIAAVRIAHRALGSTGKEDHDLSMPSPMMNRLLYEVYASERYMIGRFRAPFGVSLIALAHA